jgi:tetratricopeptide (TPR) repeat protein
MLSFNPPPGWEVPLHPWVPPRGFKKDPSWPEAPAGWNFWVEIETDPFQAVTTRSDSTQQPDLVELRAKWEREFLERFPEMEDRIALQEAGIYRYHHPLENSEQYREQLATNRKTVLAIIKKGKAISSVSTFTFENSASKGNRLIRELSSLALNAFNQEFENSLRVMKAGTHLLAKKRVLAAADKVERFGKMLDLSISPEFLALRIQELELTADYLAKQAEEKLLEREQREILREEQKARRELEAERERLEKEREHYRSALQAIDSSNTGENSGELERRLQEIEQALERNDYRINNVRAGYVYVISNEGSFGPGVLKIGMTRRLIPMDRINELGDASVPFRFSVHALFFSDDAVRLEASLHKRFENNRVNRVNSRKEFFFVSPSEVRLALQEAEGALLEFDESPVSEDFYQSSPGWPEDLRPR